MPINPAYQFINANASLDDKNQFLDFLRRDAMQKGMGANYMADIGAAQETMNVLGNQRPAQRPMPQAPRQAPVNRPATPYVAPVAQPEQFTPPEFGIPPEPPGLMAPASQMREEDLPPEAPQAPQAQPSLPQGFEQTTLAKKASELGFDPRQLLVALAEFSAGAGNIKGKPQQNTARSFYEMQKRYEQQDLDNRMRQQRMEQQPLVKPVDPLTEQYKQTQIDYLKSKMQPKPVAPSAQPDPLRQQLMQEQIALTKARRKGIERETTPESSLPVAAGGEPKTSPKAVKMASELRKEYQNNAVTKTTRDVKTQWNKVKSVLENPSAAGDMAAIFMFMKTLDPGSTVREGEYKSAAEATSAAGRIQTYAQNVASGSKLNPEQRLDFKRTIEKFYRAQMKEQDRVNREYRALAERSGIDPQDLLIESEDSVAPQKLRSVHDLPDAR